MLPVLEKPGVNRTFESFLFTIKDALSVQECDSLIELALQPDSGLGECINYAPELLKYAHSNFIIPRDYTLPTVLSEAWHDAQKFYNFEITQTEQFEMKRYITNDFMEIHNDQHMGVCYPLERKLTMIVQLSDTDDYVGGDLVISNITKINRTKGSLTIMPSFFVHEITKVTDGTRWSLNNWAWGPYWR